MLSSIAVPNDEGKGRRLGDETMGRIADLASGWTVDGDEPPVSPAPLAIKREPSVPVRSDRDAPRRKNVKTQPPPPPGSPERKALEDKIVELNEAAEAEDDSEVIDPRLFTNDARLSAPRMPGRVEPARSQGVPGADVRKAPSQPANRAAPGAHSDAANSGPVRSERSRTPSSAPPPRPAAAARNGLRQESIEPGSAKPRSRRDGAPLDLSTVPEDDKTSENRGAVGVKHERSASLTSNAVSGTIGDVTPPPLLDAGPRPALRPGPATIAAGQPGAEIGGRVTAAIRTTGSGPAVVARGTPKASGISEKPPLRAQVAPDGARGVPVALPAQRSRPVRLDDLDSDNDNDTTTAARGSGNQETTTAARGSGNQWLTVPVGEFDHGQAIHEQDKLRAAYSHATMKRDVAGALLGEPAVAPRPTAVEPPSTSARGPARAPALINDSSHSSTARFEDGDPTLARLPGDAPSDRLDDPTLARLPGDASSDRLDDTRGDPTMISGASPGHAPAGTLRTMASLRRRPGVTGDLRYVGTVVLGLRAARHELAELEDRQATRQQSRRHHLVTLGRTAVSQVESAAALAESIESDRGPSDRTQDPADHPAVGHARDQLETIEDERAQHADHVAAADAELVQVRGERDAKAKQHTIDLAAIDAELASAAEKLAPLERRARKIRKRGVDHHESLQRIDAKIAAAEASLLSVTGKKLDRSEVQAEIATLRADRKAIQSDEPAIAAELDALNPQIAGVQAARSEARRKRAELANAEHEDQRRVEEVLVAIGAQRKVVDRAAAVAEARRDKVLFQLGERLCVDRPDGLTGQLAPIDEIDVELGVADRRIMELREIQSSVDKWKLARGMVLLVVIAAALGSLGYWLFDRFY